MEPVRITCTVDGFEDTWVEVSSRWTRKEFKNLIDSEGEEWLETFHHKVTACNIETGGDAITDPSKVTEDALDDVDMQVLGFLGTVLLEAVAHLRSLGFMSGVVSSNGRAEKKANA